ncbi:MAG TPA: DNRLRE domain-containing protein [Syntrophomonadaceae bacterium]|nr:DNRLRE domain-containing protein [Syntrophomonadaceae bacterium]
MKVLTLPAFENVYISEYFSNQNFSDQSYDVLYIGRFEKPGDRYRSLLRFNINQLRKTYPTGIKIRSAYLQLFIFRNEIPSGLIQAEIYRLQDIWDKKLVTWNNQASAYSQAEQTFIIPYEWEGLILIDLTSTVRGWYKRSKLNCGIIIKGDEESNSLVGFRSTNYTDPNTHPRLKILFEDE